MRKSILLNLTGLFVFFLFTCMFISCGKSGKSKPESEESSKPPTTTVGSKATKFTTQMVVAAFEKAADRMPPDSNAEMKEQLKDPAIMAKMTEGINEALASGEVELKEISVDALADWIVTDMPKARGKANRIKCVNNLGAVYKSLLGFAQDNNERLPWQLTPAQVKNHLDAGVVANSNFGRAAGVDNLMFMHPKVLLEAAAIGRPLIATDVPGCREIEKNGENGILVKLKDVDSLHGAITLLVSNQQMRQSMGKRSREIVESELSTDIINTQTLQLHKIARNNID